MKILFLISVLFLLSNCASQMSADKLVNKPAQPTPTIVNANNDNVNNWKPIEKEAGKIDEVKRKEIEAQNDNFRQVPDEFKGIDFENFKFPLARLKNGEYEERDEKHLGGTTFSFSDAFFADLTNDTKKEAIVMLYAVSCGGSCDGGRSIIHFYVSRKNKPKLVDWIELGSRSGGCSLKSFKIKDKKIFIEQFGKCAKNSSYEENRVYSCKFCVKDLTRSIYSIKNSELFRESIEEIETPETNVINYLAEISINE